MGRKYNVNHRWNRICGEKRELAYCERCGIFRAVGKYPAFGTGQCVEYSTPEGEVISRGPQNKTPLPLCDPALYEGR